MPCEKNPLEYFMCCLSIRHKHPAIEPVALNCGHFACNSCLNNQKENTGLKRVICIVCKAKNKIQDIDCSNNMKNGMNFYSDEKLEIFKSKLNESKQKLQGIELYFLLQKFIKIYFIVKKN